MHRADDSSSAHMAQDAECLVIHNIPAVQSGQLESRLVEQYQLARTEPASATQISSSSSHAARRLTVLACCRVRLETRAFTTGEVFGLVLMRVGMMVAKCKSKSCFGRLSLDLLLAEARSVARR